jgi:Rrf2 family protein
LRMMIAIAKLSSNENPVGLKEISRHCGVSHRYLEQLIGPLKSASLVRALSGRGGGYALAKEAAQITVGDIIKAAVGPIAVTECVADPTNCIHTEYCSCIHLWTLLNMKINKVLNEYSLADLLDERWPKKIQHELSNMTVSM